MFRKGAKFEPAKYNWVGRPLSKACANGRHKTRDRHDSECHVCHMSNRLTAPLPTSVNVIASTWSYAAGGNSDHYTITLGYEWQRTTRTKLLWLSENLVRLEVEVSDPHDGDTEYTLHFGAGQVELDGPDMDPLYIAATRGQMAALILGTSKEINCPEAEIKMLGAMISGGVWQTGDLMVLEFYHPQGHLVASVPLSHELLGEVLRPWALAVTENKALVGPGAGKTKPMYSTSQKVSRNSSHTVTSKTSPNGSNLEISQRSRGTGVKWRAGDDVVILTVGEIDTYKPSRYDYGYEAYESNRSLLPFELTETTDHHFPTEQFMQIRETGWGQVTLISNEGAMLKLYEKSQTGEYGRARHYVCGALTSGDFEGEILVGWTFSVYNKMRKWAQHTQAVALY